MMKIAVVTVVRYPARHNREPCVISSPDVVAERYAIIDPSVQPIEAVPRQCSAVMRYKPGIALKETHKSAITRAMPIVGETL